MRFVDLSLAFCLQLVSFSSAQGAILYRGIASWVEFAEVDIDVGIGAHVFRVDLLKTNQRIVSAGAGGIRNAVSALVADFPLVLASNASFFDRDGSAMGLVVSGGENIQRSKLLKAWGALIIRGGESTLKQGNDVSDADRSGLVVQGIPFLVRDGKPLRLKPQIAQRTAVCADGKHIVLVSAGLVEANAFAKFLSQNENGPQCKNALNLDGGPSAQLVARFKNMNLQIPGGSGVPNALVIVPKQ